MHELGARDHVGRVGRGLERGVEVARPRPVLGAKAEVGEQPQGAAVAGGAAERRLELAHRGLGFAAGEQDAGVGGEIVGAQPRFGLDLRRSPVGLLGALEIAARLGALSHGHVEGLAPLGREARRAAEEPGQRFGAVGRIGERGVPSGQRLGGDVVGGVGGELPFELLDARDGRLRVAAREREDARVQLLGRVARVVRAPPQLLEGGEGVLRALLPLPEVRAQHEPLFAERRRGDGTQDGERAGRAPWTEQPEARALGRHRRGESVVVREQIDRHGAARRRLERARDVPGGRARVAARPGVAPQPEPGEGEVGIELESPLVGGARPIGPPERSVVDLGQAHEQLLLLDRAARDHVDLALQHLREPLEVARVGGDRLQPLERLDGFGIERARPFEQHARVVPQPEPLAQDLGGGHQRRGALRLRSPGAGVVGRRDQGAGRCVRVAAARVELHDPSPGEADQRSGGRVVDAEAQRGDRAGLVAGALAGRRQSVRQLRAVRAGRGLVDRPAQLGDLVVPRRGARLRRLGGGDHEGGHLDGGRLGGGGGDLRRVRACAP